MGKICTIVWQRNTGWHPGCPMISLLWKHGICSQQEGKKLPLRLQRDQVSNVWIKEQIYSPWSHHQIGFWPRSKAQNVSGISHLGCVREGDPIPGKRFWAPLSDPEFSRPCSHFLYLLSCVMDLPMCSGVFLRCLEHLPSWFPLNILYFPKETHKMENRTCSPGSVAETLSIQ